MAKRKTRSSFLRKIPPEVAHRLGYYVYLYLDPRNRRVFYVGKGQGQRVLAHLSEVNESRKVKKLRELQAAGLEPRLDILAHGLPNEEAAFRVEAAAIDLLGLDRLTNKVRGIRSLQTGRMPLRDVVAYYGAKRVKVVDPALLIRINRLYRHGMTDDELYEATRGVWRVGARRLSATYAMAVFEGVVREVYRIHTWHKAGTTPYSSRSRKDVRAPGRWEFLGSLAPGHVRARYRNRLVASYFKQGQQSPVVYVGC
jgi:hypothetical protein